MKLAIVVSFALALGCITSSSTRADDIPPKLKQALKYRDFGRAAFTVARETRTNEKTVRELASVRVVGDAVETCYALDGLYGPPVYSRNLFEADRRWNNRGMSGAATLQIGKFDPPPDYRAVGLLGGVPSEGGVWRSEPGEYGEDIHIFTSNDALIERRFYLDPEQGGAIARVEVWRNGQRLARSELENHLTNGVWFPSLVQEFVREEPFAQNRWRFSDFVFEKGKLPVRLSPTDIGVEVGTTVIVTEPGHEPRVNIWNGKDLEAQDSALRRLRTGDLQYGEQILLERARAGAGEDVYETVCLEAAARLDECWNTRPFDSPHEKLWEVYVRQFIQDNHLNQETQARAWQIRSDCAADVAHRQKRALLRKHLDGEKRDRELSQIADEVFAEQLIPRLKSLLTREQLNRESHSISP